MCAFFGSHDAWHFFTLVFGFTVHFANEICKKIPHLQFSLIAYCTFPVCLVSQHNYRQRKMIILSRRCYEFVTILSRRFNEFGHNLMIRVPLSQVTAADNHNRKLLESIQARNIIPTCRVFIWRGNFMRNQYFWRNWWEMSNLKVRPTCLCLHARQRAMKHCWINTGPTYVVIKVNFITSLLPPNVVQYNPIT